MAKHTPGPWKICVSRSGYSIAAQDEPVVWGGGIDRIEDARLIAAAPGLLEACRIMLSGLEAGILDEEGAILILREAINAATNKGGRP